MHHRDKGIWQGGICGHWCSNGGHYHIQFTKNEGDDVKKGDEMGSFSFSSHRCVPKEGDIAGRGLAGQQREKLRDAGVHGQFSGTVWQRSTVPSLKREFKPPTASMCASVTWACPMTTTM